MCIYICIYIHTYRSCTLLGLTLLRIVTLRGSTNSNRNSNNSNSQTNTHNKSNNDNRR